MSYLGPSNFGNVRIGSIYTAHEARVIGRGAGYAVRCDCGGTIGVSFGVPFDDPDEAFAAAHGHIEQHGAQSQRELAAAQLVHPAGSAL